MTGLDLFAAPAGLWWLLLPLSLWGLAEWRDRIRAQQLRRTLGRRSNRLAPATRSTAQRGLLALALACVCLAAADPRWGEETVEPRGVDILVCLDVSRSMLARDATPDRLAAARAGLTALADQAQGDRLGLIAFAGSARLMAPPTRDRDAFLRFVDLATPEIVRLGGTDVGAAIRLGLDVLAGRTGAHEALIIVTDGEDLSGQGREAATRAAELGITVHCIGMGTREGSRIPVPTADGEGEEFLRGPDGLPVLSSLDPISLGAVAGATPGGVFLEQDLQTNAFEALYDDAISAMARRAFKEQQRERRIPRFQWPLLAAFAVWLGEAVWHRRRRRT